MTVTQKINSLLAERGIDKKTFYRDCTISSASYSQWATGKNKPRRERLEQIAAYLGVPVEELTGEREKTAPTNEDGFSDKEKFFMRLFRQLPADRQDFVIEQLQGQVLMQTVRGVPEE